jgi:hypothetical protein
MEIELLGLRRLTEDEQRLVDAHAERDDEADWDQLQLANIPEPDELNDGAAVLPPVAADSDDENTDDAVMPTPAVDRATVPTPSVPAMVATPSARVDTNTTVSEPSVNTRGARVHAPFASVDGYTIWFLNHRCLMSKRQGCPGSVRSTQPPQRRMMMPLTLSRCWQHLGVLHVDPLLEPYC